MGSRWLPMVGGILEPFYNNSLQSSILALFCHNGLQNAPIAHPGHDIPLARTAMKAEQVVSHRQSYLNALLITRLPHQRRRHPNSGLKKRL